MPPAKTPAAKTLAAKTLAPAVSSVSLSPKDTYALDIRCQVLNVMMSKAYKDPLGDAGLFAKYRAREHDYVLEMSEIQGRLHKSRKDTARDQKAQYDAHWTDSRLTGDFVRAEQTDCGKDYEMRLLKLKPES